jgi:hypothetical protein
MSEQISIDGSRTLLNSASTKLSDSAIRKLMGRGFELGLLGVALYYSCTATSLPIDPGAKTAALSVIGWLIGAEKLLSIPLLPLKFAMIVLLSGWAFGKLPRFLYLATPVCFILLMSCVVETHYFTQHQTNFCAMCLMVIGAVKFIGSAGGKIISTVDPLPRWAFSLLLYYIAISYTFSGFMKIYQSGFGWADGKSLMMWVDVNAISRDNLLFESLTSSRPLATIMQLTTLIAELGAFLILLVPKARIPLGCLLVGFHVSVEFLMGLGFYGNIFIDFYLLVVCYCAIDYRITMKDFWQELTNAPVPQKVV